MKISLFRKEFSTYYVKGFDIGIANTSQSGAEEYIKNLADHKYSQQLGCDLLFREKMFKIIEIPQKINDYIFKIKNHDDVFVLSMKEFDHTNNFNNFCLKPEIQGTYEELLDKYKVFLAFNDGWSDKIGYTPNRLSVIYELWLCNKNLSIGTLIMNNQDLLTQADKQYFNL